MRDIMINGMVEVDYPEPLRHAVDEAVSSWKAFCALPQSEKEAFCFCEDDYGDGAGYELKAEKGDRKDLKENFHVTLYQHQRLAAIANNRTFPFLHNAKELLEKISPLVLHFAESQERDYGVAGLSEEVSSSQEYWILRYLHYFGEQQVGAELAAPHADKGGFTLHLYESDDGLQYFCIENRAWYPMPVAQRQTVIIPAIQLQLLSGGKLKALYHRVVATEKTARQGRFSMVCFIPFQKTAQYDKERHGSMQKHPVGFNYDMAHSQFAGLFQ